MAKDTYLQLVADMMAETGLSGGNAPPSIEAAAGDAKKVCHWIRIADMQIQRERIDWRFLWAEANENLTQNSSVVPAPVDRNNNSADTNTHTVLVNAIPKDRFAIIDPNGQAYFPTFLDWPEFSVLYNFQVQQATDFPSYWSIRPDSRIMLSEPIESGGMTCKYEYWRKPVPLRTGSDVSRIPDDFSHLIVLLAMIKYAAHEDAPEVDIHATAEYDVVMDQMRAVEAPMAEWQRMENSDRYLQVETR